MDTASLAVVALVFLLGKGKGVAGKSSPQKDADLVKRANQAQAKAWVPILVGIGTPQMLAEATARWFGIESSGNPLAMSSGGERGLAQITRTSALTEGALTTAEWEAMTNPKTTKQEHARIGVKVIDWCWTRAKKYVANPTGNAMDAIFYAKLYHQRPVDVRDGQLHGPALLMSRELEERWRNDPVKLHYLHAANVITFGVPIAPGGPNA